MLRLPLIGREIPVIADCWVSPEFGTGAVKVTPAHDPNDFQSGPAPPSPVDHGDGRDSAYERRGGRLCGPGSLRGAQADSGGSRNPGTSGGGAGAHQLHRQMRPLQDDCRAAPVDAMVYRIQPLADRAIAAVEEGHIRLLPSSMPRPISSGCATSTTGAFRASCGGGTAFRHGTADLLAHHRGTGRLRRSAQIGSAIEQETDVLDTWFSSASCPSPSSDGRGYARPGRFLSHAAAGDGLRHPVLLGGADDHARVPLHDRHADARWVPAN